MTDGQKRYVSQQIARKTQKIMSLYHEYEEYDRTRVLPIPAYLDPQEFSPYSDYDDPLDAELPDDSAGAKKRASKRNAEKNKTAGKPIPSKETPQQREARKKKAKLEMFQFMDDIIFHEDFKAGTTFYEKELRWKQEQELARQGPAKAAAAEETDWTVEALDDEDALQRQLDADDSKQKKK